MVDVEHDQEMVDGRSARRQRNIDAVLAEVVKMFTEGDLFPSVEAVSERSGISVRSIYRYFADPAELSDAAIRKHREVSEHLAHLSTIGVGSIEKRIDDFVAMRLRLYHGVEAAYRATVHNAPRHPRLRDELMRSRNDLRLQFEQQFRPELAALRGTARDAVLSAAELLTQLDAVEYLRRHRHLSVAEASEVMKVGLRRLLNAP